MPEGLFEHYIMGSCRRGYFLHSFGKSPSNMYSVRCPLDVGFGCQNFQDSVSLTIEQNFESKGILLRFLVWWITCHCSSRFLEWLRPLISYIKEACTFDVRPLIFTQRLVV